MKEVHFPVVTSSETKYLSLIHSEIYPDVIL